MMRIEHEDQIDFAAYVGLDWADQEHAVCLQASDSAKVETYVIKQTAPSLGEWANQLRARFGGRKVAVCLEQSRGALIYALMSYDFLVLYPVNPQTLAKYRKAFRTSGAKDDPDDAGSLMEIVKLHRNRLRAWVPDDVQTRTLQMLVESRRRIVRERTRLTNRLTSLLKAYYPQALEWAGELKSLRACDFLKKWPTLEAVKRAKGSELKKFYLQHGTRDEESIEERIKQIRESDPLTRDQAVIRSSAMVVEAIVSQLPCVIRAIERFDQEIARAFEQHPDHEVFNSFPGAGSALAPRLLAAMGSDRTRFESAREVQQFTGIAPVTEQSGKSKWVHRRLACPKFVRQTFHEFAKQSIIWSKWAHAFYDQQRKRGKHHHAAIRALAYKWIRIIFRCWMDRTVYNEQAYVEALRRRGSSLFPSPAASDSQAQNS